MAAAESADPFEGDAAASGKTRVTNGGPVPAHVPHQEGQQHYDQLKQEDEILSGGDHK